MRAGVRGAAEAVVAEASGTGASPSRRCELLGLLA
jgi:hypothetical protein